VIEGAEPNEAAVALVTTELIEELDLEVDDTELDRELELDELDELDLELEIKLDD
jgi:hypothetical protein